MPTHRTIRRHPLIHRRRRQIITSQISRITNRIRRTPKLPRSRRRPLTTTRTRATTNRRNKTTTPTRIRRTRSRGRWAGIGLRLPRPWDVILLRKEDTILLRVCFFVDLSQDFFGRRLSFRVLLLFQGGEVRLGSHVLNDLSIIGSESQRRRPLTLRNVRLAQQNGTQLLALRSLSVHAFAHRQIVHLGRLDFTQVFIDVSNIGRHP